MQWSQTKQFKFKYCTTKHLKFSALVLNITIEHQLLCTSAGQWPGINVIPKCNLENIRSSLKSLNYVASREITADGSARESACMSQPAPYLRSCAWVAEKGCACAVSVSSCSYKALVTHEIIVQIHDVFSTELPCCLWLQWAF